MTTAEPFSPRPVPDVADLRLLGEIINNGAIGLPQAAWNAGMSQSEAAARLVTMAERGMPLRLVAEGDRQQLWHIAQAGPVQPFPPAPTGAASTGPIAQVPVEVLGADATATEMATPSSEPSAVWGVPGSSSWVRSPEDGSGFASDTAPDAGEAPSARSVEPEEPDTPEHAAAEPAAAGEATTGPDDDLPPAAGADPAEPSEAAPTAATRRTLTAGQPVQAVEGLFGEQLDVGLQQILDPADTILSAVGYRIEPGERALLVQTSVGNRGPADYESLADLYLEIVDSTSRVLRKAAMSVNGYPAHQVGVPAHTLVSGWTVFLIPADSEVAQVKWSVRPDLAYRTVSWVFGPASDAS